MSRVCHLDLTSAAWATTSSDQMALTDVFQEEGTVAIVWVVVAATIIRKVV